MSHRTFTPEFKRKVVEDHLHGGRTIAEICREYQLSRNVFNRWRDQYLSPAPASPPAEDAPRQLREAEQRIAELESALGGTAMELDFMRRCFRGRGQLRLALVFTGFQIEEHEVLLSLSRVDTRALVVFPKPKAVRPQGARSITGLAGAVSDCCIFFPDHPRATSAVRFDALTS